MGRVGMSQGGRMRFILEGLEVEYGNATKGPKIESQVCNKGRVNKRCHKFLGHLLPYGVSGEQGTVVC